MSLAGLTKMLSIGSALSGSAALAVIFGMAYTLRCDVAASRAGRSFEQCWLAGGAFMGIGAGTALGYNIPNPKLDKARHQIALELDRPTERAAAAPPSPIQQPYIDHHELPTRDESGRFKKTQRNHDPSGRFSRPDPRG